METTTIAGRAVPIEPGPTTKLTFSGAAEPYDNGPFEFWTLVVPVNNLFHLDIRRQQAGKDPGERWRRDENNSAYKKYNDLAKRAVVLTPAAKEQVEAWLNSHLNDAKHAAESCEVAGIAMKLSGPPYVLQKK